MAVSDWSTTASANTTINGIGIGENCPAANLNDAVREMMAEIKSYSLTVTSPTGNYMPLSGGTFTGAIKRQGGGNYTYFASSSMTGGAIYVQSSTAALPTSPAEGTIVFQY
jgi:hypothetical protein